MFEFTEDCIMGVDQLDDEHRHLFDLINDGIDMLHNEYVGEHYGAIKDLLAELENYAEEHFTHEEAHMEKLCDPELILQRTQHMFFRDKIRECSFHNIDQEEGQRAVLEELMQFLAKWLYHHILSSDILIGKLPPLEEWMVRENPCEFTEQYLTGIELIDKEHKVLFQIMEKANNLIKNFSVGDSYEPLMEILAELKKYTVDHFSDEEEYMESIHYSGLAAQKRAHESFIAKIDEVKVEDIEKNPRDYLASLMEFLLGWLINHILHTDKKIPQA